MPGGRSGEGCPMNRFQEVVSLLDKAIGGPTVSIGIHGPFWRGKTKDDFIEATVIGQEVLIVGDGANSNLIKALRGEPPFGTDTGSAGAMFRRMPAGRPPMPPENIAILQRW